MQMSDPAPCNPLDKNRLGLIGKPIERVDDMLKLTGKAAYAYEVREPNTAGYGFIVEASIAIRPHDLRALTHRPAVGRALLFSGGLALQMSFLSDFAHVGCPKSTDGLPRIRRLLPTSSRLNHGKP